MSLGSWNPDAKNPIRDKSDINIRQYIGLGTEQAVESAIAALSGTQIDELTPLMNQDRSFWIDVAGELSTDEIINLIRFFTLAEEKHSQLYAGELSPVIGLNQLLKRRKIPLPRELLLWIKAHSSNRFLPNGSVL